MDISRISIQNQALAAQLYGSQAGAQGGGVNGVNPFNQQMQVGAIGTENTGSQNFDWRNLSKFDNFLTTSTPQTGVGKTNEFPTEVGGVGLFGAKEVGAQFGSGQVNNQNTLMAALESIDAKDIGLNGDRNGFQGQKRLNLMA